MTVIEDIKTRVDIVDLVGETVALRKAGRTFKAPCPFHNEKTPSFIVSPDRQTWHCFGACGTGGDIFTFVQRRDGVEFADALRVLAERAGVQMETSFRRKENDERYERHYAANEAAATFYQNRLLQGEDAAEARAYIEKRGLDDATVRAFRLGYAPEGWDAVRGHLERRGFTAEDLLAAGLLVESDRGGYDRFRDRLIFPIGDDRGRIIGFGGRALGDPSAEGPKYLNTAQTDVFDKSGVLYALDRAKDAVRKDGAVIVEGYMDVIAAHQYGYTNVVASMGTALTERQVNILKRHTRNLVLALDADAAGSEATLRGIQVVVEAADRESVPVPNWRGLIRSQETLAADIHIVAMPQGKDPDDVIRERPEAWAELIATSKPVIEHLLAVARERFDVSDPRERSRMVEMLLPALNDVADPVVRAHYVQRLATLARVPETDLTARLRRGPRPNRAVEAPQAPARRAQAPEAGRADFLLALLYRHPSLQERGLGLEPVMFWHGEHRALFESWRTRAGEPPEEGSQEAALFERLAGLRLPPYDADAASAAFDSALSLLERERLRDAKRLSTAAVAEETERLDQRKVVEEALAALGEQGEGSDISSIVLRDLDAGRRLHEAVLTARVAGADSSTATRDDGNGQEATVAEDREIQVEG